MLHSEAMALLGSILDQVRWNTIVDIGITALLIYWLFSLIRGTRAVRLVIGVSVLFVVYALAVAFELRLLTTILQDGAVVGLFALVVIFQPELRRALERIGRVGSFAWLLSPAESRAVEHVATEVAGLDQQFQRDGRELSFRQLCCHVRSHRSIAAVRIYPGAVSGSGSDAKAGKPGTSS